MAVQLNEAFVRKALPPRPKTAHKGSFGKLGILAGSLRYRGAALLATEGALRTGVGLVQLASVEAVCAAAAVRLPTCTLLPLAQDAAGGIAPGGEAALLAQTPAAVLCGCGLGNTKAAAALVLALLENARCPLVLDADALNVLAGHLDKGQSGPWAARLVRALNAGGNATRPVVLTPHIGEMARLCGRSTSDVQQNQQQAATEYAAAHHCVVVLKSHHTVVASPEGEVFLNDEAGNAGLAKGGSGDVLAGVIAGLLAQGMAPPLAAACGVWLHAAAGDLAAAEWGTAALSPAELGPYLGAVQKRLGR